MEFLKAILGEELFSQFEVAVNAYNEKPENKDKQVKLADLSTGDYVGKGKYSALETDIINLKEQIKTNEKTIETLKNANKDNETLQQTIKDHEATIQTLKTTYEGKIKELTINTAIQSKLTDAKYPELIAGKFDKSKLSISEDGTVLGIDEQLTSIKETYKDLFTPVVKGKEPNNNGSASKSITKEAFGKMSYKERVELFNTDQELYKSLSE